MRLKSCKKCGAIFETARRYAYLCPACADASRKASVYRTRTCIDCGASFMGFPKSKRCPTCQASANRKRDAAIRRDGPKRRLGSVDACACCGKEYVVENGRQRYCKSCAPAATRQNINATRRKYMADNAERISAQKAKNRSYNKVCIICGKVFDADTPTVTCSPECAEKLKYIRQGEADYRRGKRKSPPSIKEDKND